MDFETGVQKRLKQAGLDMVGIRNTNGTSDGIELVFNKNTTREIKDAALAILKTAKAEPLIASGEGKKHIEHESLTAAKLLDKMISMGIFTQDQFDKA